MNPPKEEERVELTEVVSIPLAEPQSTLRAKCLERKTRHENAAERWARIQAMLRLLSASCYIAYFAANSVGETTKGILLGCGVLLEIAAMDPQKRQAAHTCAAQSYALLSTAPIHPPRSIHVTPPVVEWVEAGVRKVEENAQEALEGSYPEWICPRSLRGSE